VRVLVCGGRAFDDYATIIRVLDRVHASTTIGIELVIHGDAKGADRLGGAWATLRRLPVLAFPAHWQTEGPAAGPLRNQRMLDDGKPDLVVGFPGGTGTRDMLSRAEKAGVLRYELPTRFILDPGPVTSSNDGQRHNIPANQLAYLYSVPLNRTVNAADTRGRGGWPANWPVLSPRFDGAYSPAKGIEDP